MPMNKLIPFTLVVTATVLSASVVCADDNRLPLPLADGLRMALSRNPDLRVESLSYATNEADLARAYGIYDPTLSIFLTGSGYSTARDNRGTDKSMTSTLTLSQFLPTGGTVSGTVENGFWSFARGPGYRGSTDNNSSVSASFSQPVLKNFGPQATEFTITSARNAVDDALERYRSLAIDTTSSLIGTYNRLYAARLSVQAKQQSLEAAQTLLTETTARQPTGGASRLDVANAEYGVVQRQKEVVDAERNARDTEGSLRYIIGTIDPTPIYPTDSPSLDEPQESEDQAVAIAKEMRPDLKQLRLALKIAGIQERISRNQTLPDFVITGTAALTGSRGSISDNIVDMGYGNGYWTLGGQFTYPIGNTAAESDYRKAKIRTEQLKRQIAALELKTENDVKTDMRAIISARLQLRVSKKAREAAEQRLEENRESNRRGGGATTQNVLEAEADLAQSRISEIEAAEGFSAAVVKLWRDMGVLLERKGLRFVKPGELPDEPGARPHPVPTVAPPPFIPAPPVPSPAVPPPPAAAPAPEAAPQVAPSAAPSAAAIVPASISTTGATVVVRLVDAQGTPLAAGTRVHDLSGNQVAVDASGRAYFPRGSTSYLPIVAYPNEAPCWGVVAVPESVGTETVTSVTCPGSAAR